VKAPYIALDRAARAASGRSRELKRSQEPILAENGEDKLKSQPRRRRSSMRRRFHTVCKTFGTRAI